MEGLRQAVGDPVGVQRAKAYFALGRLRLALCMRTVAVPACASAVHTKMSPGSAPRMVATVSGIVARTEEDVLTDLSTLDLNSRTRSCTVDGLKGFALRFHLPIDRRLP